MGTEITGKKEENCITCRIICTP